MSIWQRRSWRKTQAALADPSGFTINELIVAMVVGSILIGYAFELYTFASRIVSHWRARTELEGAAQAIFHRMMLDLQRSSDVTIDGDTVLVMQGDTRVTALYRISRGTVVRNDAPMNAPDVVQVSVHASRVGNMVDLGVCARARGNEIQAGGRAVLQSSSTAKLIHRNVGG